MARIHIRLLSTAAVFAVLLPQVSVLARTVPFAQNMPAAQALANVDGGIKAHPKDAAGRPVEDGASVSGVACMRVIH